MAHGSEDREGDHDKALVARARRGDVAAFDLLVRRHRGWLLRVGLRRQTLRGRTSPERERLWRLRMMVRPAKVSALLFWLLVVCWTSLAVAQEDLQQLRGLGERPPTRAEQAYINTVYTEVTSVAPNELAWSRAWTEAEESAREGERGPLLDGLPGAVDNSILPYFPPIGSQGGQGSCTCWATGYYYNTYTQAADEGYNVSGGDDQHICSPAFLYPLVNGGADAGANTAYVVSRLNDIGCSNWALKPYYSSDYRTWPSEAAWVNALKNRTQSSQTIDGSTPAGLDAIKQHLANGNVAVSRFDVYSTFYQDYPLDRTGVHSGVYYAIDGSIVGGHAVTLVGYDDSKSYVDHRDGQTHYGAFLAANSWGSSWGLPNSTGTGTAGFFWIAYSMFLERTFGPNVYYNTDRDNYRPKLYAVAAVNHVARGSLTLNGGVGPVALPSWVSPCPVSGAGGLALGLDDTKAIAVDLSDGAAGPVSDAFIRLAVSSAASTEAIVTRAEFYSDFDGDGIYAAGQSSDPRVVVTQGHVGHAALTTGWGSVVYVDSANAAGPWDGSTAHPYRTIQDGVDACSSGDRLAIAYGSYDEHVSVDRDLVIEGKGWGRTVVAPSSAGPAFDITAGTHVTLRCLTLAGEGAAGMDGIHVHGAQVTVDSVETRNAVVGVAVDGSDPSCLLTRSVVAECGVGVNASAGTVEIDRCTVARGTVGIALQTEATVRNTIVSENEEAGITRSLAAPNPSVVFCDVWSNGADYVDCTAGSGCISADPLFLDAAEGYYCLGYGSECVNAGAMSGATNDGQTDMGACPAVRAGLSGEEHSSLIEAAGMVESAWGKASVVVSPGVYQTYAAIRGPVSLIGASPSTTLIDGSYAGCATSAVYLEDGATGSAVAGLCVANRPTHGVLVRGHTNDGGPVDCLVKNIISRGNANYGLYVMYDSSPRVLNSTISGNQYGIWVSSATSTLSAPVFRNNIVAANTSGGICKTASGLATPSADYNDVWANATDFYNVTPGVHCISADPLFANPAAHDYHLSTGSPCIDAGDPTTDWSREPAPNGGRVNLGAYGNTPEATVTSYVPHGFSVTCDVPVPATVESGGATVLGATAADELGHSAASWSWDDGGAGGSFSPSATVQNPTYIAPVNQTDSDLFVTLTVEATCEGPTPESDSDSTTLTVQPVAHALTVTADPPSPSTVASGGSASLSASFSDSRPGHTITTWCWDDGGAGGSFSPSAAVQNPTYTAPAYTGDDLLMVILTVTATCDGALPLTDSASVILGVEPVPHTLQVTANAPAPDPVPSGGSASLSASFSDSRTGHSVTSWSWHDSGAGGSFAPSNTVQNPTYTAAANTTDSNCIVTLTVNGTCDGPGPLGDDDSTSLTVEPVAHTLDVYASADPPEVESAGSTSLTANYTDTRTGHSIASWSWSDAGAGGSFSPSASVQNPVYIAAENSTGADRVVHLTLTATCDGPSPLIGNDTVDLTVHALSWPMPKVVLEEHPNERGPGSSTAKVGLDPWTRTLGANVATYWWQDYKFSASGVLWVQVCAQNWSAKQIGVGRDDDNTRVTINGVIPGDYDGVQTGPVGGYQWTGNLESGERWTLRFLRVGAPGVQIIRIAADEQPVLWWLKVTDLEPETIYPQ